MNPVVEFLRELRSKNVSIAAQGNQLVCEAPPGVLTLDLRERMSALKPAILRLLGNTSAQAPGAATEKDQSAQLGRLSRAQSSIWLLEQINPGTSMWNVSWALEVRGAVDHGALEAAFRTLIERHDTLRSRFRSVNGAPVVDCAPLGEWSIGYRDLRGLPNAEEQAAALTKAEVQKPFNLENGPLCRVRLLQTADLAYVLMLVVHHIVADGWSLRLMGLELNRIYEGVLSGEAAALPPLRADYHAYVRQVRRDEAASQADLDWWRAKLSGELPIISLADDNARAPSGAGRRVSIELGPELTNRIEAFARQHCATPFMLLLAAFKLLIHRYTGHADVLVGVQTSGRDRPEFADVIGMFVNTLVLRTAVTPDITVAELLSRVRESSLESFARQQVPFDRVVEAVKPRRMLGHNPLVRHAFVYQNLPPVALRLGSAELRHKPLELAGSRYELSVEIWRSLHGLLCDFEYATDLFDAERIDRLMGHYRHLLAELVADPERRLCDLPLLPDAEREQLLTTWNATGTDYPVDRRLDHLFASQAATTPDAPALVYRGREMSYAELEQRANQLANHLRALDVGPDVLVGVFLERSPDLVVAILAVLKAGGAYVPLDPKYPSQRLAYMLEDSAAPVLITRSALQLPFAYAGYVVDLDVDRAPIAKQSTTAPVTGATAENLAYVIYTSGSTGRPKGTMLRHSAGYLVDWARRTFTAEELSRVVAGTSICFDLSVFELFAPLCTGGAVLLVADPLDMPDPSSRPTMLNTVPSALAELARVRAIPDTVRTVIACGEKLNGTVVQALYQAANVERVYNVYGPTEYTTYATAALTVRDTAEDPPIGRPLCNTRVYVLDAWRQLVPVGVAGELYIAGHGLACGYLGQVQLTAERFVDNPFGPTGSRMYRTGDLVRWSADGQLEFIGRKDHQIKLRGFRIELGEIEASLRRHPAVRDAVVVARQDKPGNTQLASYIVAEGEAPSPTALRQHLKGWLPEYMVPSSFVVLSGFPLTPSGKIDRAALPASSPEHTAPSGETEWMLPIQAIIADTFKRVLGLDDFAAADNFFDRGGHSLHVIEVAAQLEQALARPVSPALIFQAPSLHELAPLLDAARVTPTSHIAPLQPLGNRPPLFCLHDLFSSALSYVSLARHLEPQQPVYGIVPGPLEDAIVANPSLDVLTPAYVAAIRTIQPRGPYRVVGYSFGGLTAFDVAHALVADGEEVLLIMADPYVYRATPTLAQAAKWASRRGKSALRDIWTADDPVMPRVVGTARWAHRQGRRFVRKFGEDLTRRRMPGAVTVASAVPDWISPGGKALATSLLQAEAAYRYRPYHGSVLFLQGTIRNIVQDFVNVDDLNGWGDLLKGPLTRLELPTRHDWMLRNPVVSQVAEVLRAL